MRQIIALILLSLSPVSHAGILMISHFDGNAGYLEHSIPNHRDYADCNGYSYIFFNGTLASEFQNPNSSKMPIAKGSYWQKLVAVEQALSAIDPHTGAPYEWLAWFDADVIFANNEKGLADVIETYATDHVHLLIASDHFIVEERDFFGLSSVNTGVFLLRNSEWSRNLLKEWRVSFDHYKNHRTPEQSALSGILGGFDDINSELSRTEKLERVKQNPNVAVVPQRVLNPKIVDDYISPEGTVWQPGDMVVHFMGPKPFKDMIPNFLECLKTDKSGRTCDWAHLGSVVIKLKALFQVVYNG